MNSLLCQRSVWAVLALFLLVGSVAVSSDSLWIDEALTAMEASQNSLAECFDLLRTERFSDLQMPFYFVWMWAWVKLFGASEWVLRASNMVWFVSGGLLLFLAVRQSRIHWGFLLGPILVSPFCWFYLNEARPYAMQIGATFAIAGALVHWANFPDGMRRSTPQSGPSERGWVIVLLMGMLALAGSSLLGMIWAAAVPVLFFVVVPASRVGRLLKRSIPEVCLVVVLLAALGVYYLWTVKTGARSSTSTATDVRSLAFVIYELSGFAGLGPGRLTIRSDGLEAFKTQLPWLLAYGVAMGVILLAALANIFKPKWIKVAVLIALPVVFILTAGIFLQFRVMGRHLAPLAVVVCLLLGLGLAALWRRGGLFRRSTVGLFLTLSLVSCLFLRFAERHKRDDYRAAAMLAKSALNSGEVVWWSADPYGASYYGVDARPASPDGAGVVLVRNISDRALVELSQPGLVIASKPDLYDNSGVIVAFLSREGYVQETQLPAFEIWTFPAGSVGNDPELNDPE